MRAGWRRALLAGGLGAAMTLCSLGLQPLHRTLAQGDGIHGPYSGVPASPTIVDLQTAPHGTTVDLRAAARGGGHQQPPILPDLYPGGEARLDQEKAAAMQLPPSLGVRTIPAAAPGTLAAASLISGTGFDGIDDAESFCGCKPPDGAIAASPTYLLATVNTAFAIWDKSGHPLVGGPTSLSGLFGGCLATYPHMSDPFTDYDAAVQRFVLGILTYDDGYNSSICMAVSRTSDPTAQWNVYSFPVSSTPNNYLLDFPRTAIASNAIYVGGNLFQYQPGNPFCPNGFCFLGAGLYAYDKTQMYQGQPVHYLGYTVSGYDTLTPARAVGLSDPAYASGTEYFTAADNSCSLVTCNTLRLWKWNAFSGAAPTYQGSVTVNAYGEPPNAVQPGTSATIDTNDARELGAYWAYDTASGDTIYGAHTVGCNPGAGTVACVQWYRLGQLEGTPVLLQQGILAGNGQYRFYPNLAVDGAGDMAIGYAYSSSSEYAGNRYTGLARDGTPEPEAVLKTGETTIDGSRYGDFAGEVVDPDGCTIWHFEEYARAGSLWGTWAGSFRFSSCAASDPGASPSATSTAVSPTSTVAPPAATAVQPTSTPTHTAASTAQAAASPTSAPTATVPVAPTATPTPTDIPSPTATATDIPSPTPAATATDTASPDPTATVAARPTLRPHPTATTRPTLRPHPMATARPTATHRPRATAAPTARPSPRPTATKQRHQRGHAQRKHSRHPSAHRTPARHPSAHRAPGRSGARSGHPCPPRRRGQRTAPARPYRGCLWSSHQHG